MTASNGTRLTATLRDTVAARSGGVGLFGPGPGWGGRCSPFAPFCMAWTARECGLGTLVEAHAAVFVDSGGDYRGPRERIAKA